MQQSPEETELDDPHKTIADIMVDVPASVEGPEISQSDSQLLHSQFCKVFSTILSSLVDSSSNASSTEMMLPIKELLIREWENGSQDFHEEIKILGVPFRETQMARSLVVSALGNFFAMMLPKSKMEVLGRRMKEDICAIMKKGFLKFKHCYAVCLSLDIKQARIFTLQSALHFNYPLLTKEGRSSVIRPPVVYGTEECSLFKGGNLREDMNGMVGPWDEKKRYAWELLQSIEIFKKVASREESTHPFPALTLDLVDLEQEIERDKARGNLPCAVFATALDDLKGIRKICDRHHLWLHVENASSTLLLASATVLQPTVVDLLEYADSLSAKPFEWFGYPAPARLYTECDRIYEDKPEMGMGPSTCLTFLRSDRVKTHPAPFRMSMSEFQHVFNLWHVMQTSDIPHLKRKVDKSLNLCHRLRQSLKMFPNDFKAHGLSLRQPEVVFFLIEPELDLKTLNMDINQFQKMLVGNCRRQMEELRISTVLLDTGDEDGERIIVFKFQPLAIADICDVLNSAVDVFVKAVADVIKLLKITVDRRKEFFDVLNKFPDIQCIMPDKMNKVFETVIGLGAFRFVPPVVSNDAVASVNQELHRLLSAKREDLYQLAVTCGSRPNNELVCIIIGFTDVDVSTIAKEIEEAGKKLQYPPEVLNRMSDAVKEGIQMAQKKLDAASIDSIGAGDIVRSIPLVGGLYSWLLPKDSPKSVSPTIGQRFDMISVTLKPPIHEKLSHYSPEDKVVQMKPQEQPQQVQVQSGDNRGNVHPHPVVVFVLGGPGAGKGTNCSMLMEEYSCVQHLSAGDCLRMERNSGSANAELINTCITEGKIVPVEITVNLLKNAMDKHLSGGKWLFLIDGFPRNLDNWNGWLSSMTEFATVAFCLTINVDEEILVQRLLARGKSSGRADDNLESIKKRLQTYDLATKPITDFFKKNGMLKEVDGSQGSIVEVYLRVRTHFERLMKEGISEQQGPERD